MPDDPPEFKKTTIPLPATHGWTCKPGNNLFVAERGAASFEIPDKWVIRHDGKQTVSIHDLPPPGDSCRISLTIFHLPPVQGGWEQLPIAQLMESICERDKNKKKAKPTRKPEVHIEPRADLQLAWMDSGDWADPENGKLIHCRQILARARLVQVLITFDVYREKEAQFDGAWKDLLKSLRLAVPRDLMGQVGN